jgi:hypothetical protein
MPKYTDAEKQIINIILNRTLQEANRFDEFIRRQAEWRKLKDEQRQLKKRKKRPNALIIRK